MNDSAKGCFAVVGLILVVALLAGGCVVSSYGCRVAKVADQQFGPEAALKKYEEFKDIAAHLDAKKASLDATEARLLKFEQGLADVPRSKWSRTQESEHALLNQELLGMKASYNTLAADYNARMAKINYSFANVGELPKGADRPLPREYRPYESK